MGLAIAESLKGDKRRREEEAGKEVDTLLGSDSLLHREAWHQLKGWYWYSVDHAPPPAQLTLERITAERVELYISVPPPGANIPISVKPFLVYDSVPTKDKIKWVVKRLQNHRSGVPLGMQAAVNRKEREESAAEK